MLKEITVAAEFFARLFRVTPGTPQHERFMSSLSTALHKRCIDHWHPTLHSAHRAVTIFGGVPDQILLNALKAATPDDQFDKVVEWVPKELVVWIDPSEVAFRIGDRGLPATLYKEGVNLADSDSDSGFSDGSEAAASLRTPSPTGGKRYGISPPVSRAVRITAPGSAPASTPATSNGSAKPTPPLSPLGQAVMNAAARTQNTVYTSMSSTSSTVFTPSSHYMPAQQPQHPYFHQHMMQPPMRGSFSSSQATFYPQQPAQPHYRRASQSQSSSSQMAMHGSMGAHAGKPRANSPPKSMVRYVEAR